MTKINWRLLTIHLLYFALLLIVYNNYVVSTYKHPGIIALINVHKILFSIIIIFSLFIMLSNKYRPSYYYLNLIIVFSVTPALVLFSGSDLSYEFSLIVFFALFVIILTIRFVKLKRININHIDSLILLRFLALISILFVLSILAFGGGKFINFDLKKVYDFRKESAENLPMLYGYFVSNFSKVIVPLGIVLSLLLRQIFMLNIFVFCAIMIFALTSNKAPLFMPFVVAFVYWVSKYRNKEIYTIFILTIMVLVGGASYFYGFNERYEFWKWFGALFIYRTIIIPSYLDWCHFDFFYSNQYYYWSDSKLIFGLVDSPYDIAMPFQIGSKYFNSVLVGANTGWIGSGLGQAGIVGVFIYSFFIGLLLKFIDIYSDKIGYRIVLSIFLIPITVITRSVDLVVAILSHGLITLIFLIIILEPQLKHKTILKSLNNNF